MQRSLLILALGLALAGTAFAGGRDIDKVNGTIRLSEGESAGDLSTVNGSIHLGAKAQANKVETVNGAVEAGDDCTLGSLETVNGSVSVGERSRVQGTVEAVNGAISLDRGVDVGGRVSNVNGRIELESAHVGGGLETVGGDITVGADSRVEGGLVVKRPSGISINFGEHRVPRIVIGPNAVVEGTLSFEREVELYVSDSAHVGKVVGATAKTFSGSRPQG